MKVAVLGATGTAGSRVVARLREKGAEIVEVSRATGVDLVSGEGLSRPMSGADTVVDAANAFNPDDSMHWGQALATATRNVIAACGKQNVPRPAFLSVPASEGPFSGRIA